MQYRPATAEAVGYIKDKFGCDPEFLWIKTPNNAAFRHPGNKKWFAALLMDMPRRTLGVSGEGRVDVLNLKCDPLMIGSLMDGKHYLPGYHMNKEHWISVLLDDGVLLGEVCSLIDMSYSLIDKRK